MEPIVFKRWSNKGYAVLNTIHRVIRIGTLSLAYNLLQCVPATAQQDSVMPLMIIDLEEVETTGLQEAAVESSLQRQVTVIGQQQLNLLSVRSLPAILEYQPGVDIRTRGPHGIQSDISISGSSFDQSLVLINGIVLNDPQTGHFNLNLPLVPASLHRVEILKGPAAGTYGPGAYAGAINFVTRPADTLALSATLAIGQYHTQSASASLHLPAGPIRNLVAASLSESNGYRKNTDFRKRSVYLHSRAGREKTRADLIMGLTGRTFGANAFYTPRFPEQYEETRTWFGAVSIETGKPSLSFSGQVYWRRNLDHYLLIRSDPSFYENHHLTDVSGITAGAKTSNRLGVTALRMRYRRESIRSTSLGKPLIPSLPVYNHPGKLYDHAAGRQLLSISALHSLQLQKLYINGNLLLQTIAEKPFEAGIYPGMSLAWLHNRHTSLFASVNRSMRLPTFTDLYYSGPQNRGNPGLQPETALVFEGGLRKMGLGWSVENVFFYRQGKQTIDWIWHDSIWITENITELNARGGEAILVIEPGKLLPATRVPLQIRLAYSYTALSKPADSHISNYVLDNLRHQLIADMGIYPRKWFLDVKITWQDRNGSYLYHETPESLPYETPYKPFLVMDIHAGINLERVAPYLDVTNLLNTSYRDVGSVVMPGRWITAGIRFR